MKINFQRILCATDLSNYSNQAVIQAIGMAKEFGATLYICHVIDLPLVTMHGVAFVYQENQIEEMKAGALNQIESLVADYDFDCNIIVDVGPVASSLCRLAKENSADLVIVSTHGHTGLKRLFLGSVTERLLRTISTPLLVVTPSGKTVSPVKQFKGFGFSQILVGCDFSAASDHAVSFGLSLAQEFEAVIHLVHVIEPFIYRDTMLTKSSQIESSLAVNGNCEERLEALVPQDARNWCTIKTSCESGKPFQVLKSYADDNQIDLIVLGVRGQSLVETLLLGSTTDRVIRNVSCPVLSVCPP